MAQAFRRIGKYELLDEIGRGGFAVVYKARDVELDRLVALKVLRPALSDDPDFVARFKQEARAAAGLKHPHIVTVYDAVQIDGQLIIAMQYVEGHTLRDELQAQGALPFDRAMEILEQIAGALDYAHQRGIVHRDVKPANILLEETSQGVHATLLDFGLAKAMQASTALTSQGTLLGSPEYMAPEQADPDRAKEIGPATDRYALGIVAYQLLTGRVPFQGNTPATLNAHLNLKPTDPHTLRAEVSPQVSAVLLKMLAKAPADRYASAREFVQALRIAAAPPTPRRLDKSIKPPRPIERAPEPVRTMPAADHVLLKWLGATSAGWYFGVVELPLIGSLLNWVGLILAVPLFGAGLGVLQGLILRPRLSIRRWLLVNCLGLPMAVGVAVLSGALVARLFPASSSSDQTSAVIVGLVGLLMFGLALGLLQFLALRHAFPQPSRWVWANAVAWLLAFSVADLIGLALGQATAPVGTPPPAETLGEALGRAIGGGITAYLIWPGVMFAVLVGPIVGAITGMLLRRFLHEKPTS